MTEPAYYKLTKVEALLRCSRDTINIAHFGEKQKP